MSDIVERLRDVRWYQSSCELQMDAAAEIERLRAALRDLLDASERHIFSTECQKERDAARAALAQEKPNDR